MRQTFQLDRTGWLAGWLGKLGTMYLLGCSRRETWKFIPGEIRSRV